MSVHCADDTRGAVKHPQNDGSDVSVKECVLLLLDPKMTESPIEKVVKAEDGSKLQHC